MGRKRRRSLIKKRGDEDEEVEVVGDSVYSPPTDLSSPLGLSVIQTYNSPVQLRYSTRRAKALLGETATNNTSLRFPIRNVVKDIISQSSPLRPSGNVLAEEMDSSNPATTDILLTSKKFNSEVPKIQVPNYVAEASMDPNDEAKGTPSATGTPMLLMGDKTVGNLSYAFAESRDWSIPTCNDFQELHELTSILGHFHADGCLFAAKEVVPDNHQMSRVTDMASESNVNRAEETLNNLMNEKNYLFAANEIVSDNPQPKKVTDVASESNENRAEGTVNSLDKTKKQLTLSSSINYTEIATMFADDCSDAGEVSSTSDPALVTVIGYRVKEELAPVLRSIILKYGDIAKGSSNFSIRTRSLFLEMVCGIYRRLEKIEPRHVTLVELKSMIEEVRDLEAGGLDVKWLHQRLDDIFDALQVSKVYKSLKEAHQRDMDTTERKKMELKRDEEAADRKKKEWEELEEKVRVGKGELDAIKAKDDASTKKYLDLRAKMKTLNQSFVYGLL